MAHPFRIVAPIRTCTRTFPDYHNYKPYLAKDFNQKCGYTNCSQMWFGGQRTFQIDHLKPWTKYPELKTDYSNLVYCCSYVNEHFERDDMGCIIPKTNQGRYMVKHMHLNLYRYAIIWNLDRLTDRIKKLKMIHNPSHEVKGLLSELLNEYFNYTQYLGNNQ